MKFNINKQNIQGITIPFAITLILAMIVVPMPPFLLDILFVTNIVISLCVLMACVFAKKPLEFSIFPTIVLLATMMRLSLNVASTRVILLHGHLGHGASGQIIESFGNFVIGGNFIVGIIIFVILAIINFIVVTKGTERVSEVSARFTLDAMPGKQMAIDADVGSGACTQEEAKIKRNELSQESQFYGSMDGATKFVKGDAIAGVLILLINLIAGIIIGTTQKDMSFGEAAQTYLLLSIGDGLVAILPSIIMSLATAIISTKVSNNTDLGEMVRVQFFSNPMIVIFAGVIVCIIGLIPAMPNVLFLTIGSLLIFTGKKISDSIKSIAIKEESLKKEESKRQLQQKKDVSISDLKEHDNILLEVGSGLSELIKTDNTQLIQSITGERIELSKEYGIAIDGLCIKPSFELDSNEYRIYIKGLPRGRGEVYSNLLMAVGDDLTPLDGIAAKDPAFGLNGYWIMSDMAPDAELKGYEVLEPNQIITTHISITLQKHLDSLVDTDSIQKLIQQIEKNKPTLVSSAIKSDQSLVTLLSIVKSLLHERVPVVQFSIILEAMAELQTFNGITTAGYLSEVRKKLMPWIIEDILSEAAERNSLNVVVLGEETLSKLQQCRTPDGTLYVEPEFMKSIVSNLQEANDFLTDMNMPLVLLTDGQVRHGLFEQLYITFPNIHVLAFSEIGSYTAIEIAHVIS